MITAIQSLLMCLGAASNDGEPTPSWAMFVLNAEQATGLLSVRDKLNGQGEPIKLTAEELGIEVRWLPLHSIELANDFDAVTVEVVASLEGLHIVGESPNVEGRFFTQQLAWEDYATALMHRGAGLSHGDASWLSPKVLLCTKDSAHLKADDILEDLWGAVGEELEYLDEPTSSEDSDQAISAIRDHLPSQAELSGYYVAAAA